VPSIVSSAKPGNYIRFSRQQVGYMTLALISSLGANNYINWHDSSPGTVL
jgi:hypothetical protein